MKWIVLFLILAATEVSLAQVTIGRGRTPASKPASRPVTIRLRADTPEDVRRWFESQPELRKQEIAALENEYRVFRKSFGEARGGLASEAKKALRVAQGDKSRFVYVNLYPGGALRGYWRPTEIGIIGRFKTPPLVVSVAGPNKLLARQQADEYFWISGVSTEGIVDGGSLRGDQPFRCVGTKQYQGAIGVKTVWHFVPFQPENYIVPTTQPATQQAPTE